MRKSYVFTPTCLSVNGRCLPQCILGYTPWADIPAPWPDTPQEDIPHGQTSLGRHPLARHPPWSDNPPGQTPPWPDTPLARHPPWPDNTPGQTPPGQTPPGQTPPGQRLPWADTPPFPVDDYSCGRYASYWNAFLFKMKWSQPKSTRIVLIIEMSNPNWISFYRVFLMDWKNWEQFPIRECMCIEFRFNDFFRFDFLKYSFYCRKACLTTRMHFNRMPTACLCTGYIANKFEHVWGAPGPGPCTGSWWSGLVCGVVPCTGTVSWTYRQTRLKTLPSHRVTERVLTEAGIVGALRRAHHVDKVRVFVGDDVVRIAKFISGHIRVNHRERVKVTQPVQVKHLRSTSTKRSNSWQKCISAYFTLTNTRHVKLNYTIDMTSYLPLNVCPVCVRLCVCVHVCVGVCMCLCVCVWCVYVCVLTCRPWPPASDTMKAWSFSVCACVYGGCACMCADL